MSPVLLWPLLNVWDDDEPILHTFADDLESFFWVILCVLLSIGAECNSLTGKERKWLLAILTTDDPCISGHVKGSTLWMLETSVLRAKHKLSPVFKIFLPFFTDIIPLMNKATMAVDELNSDNLPNTHPT
ncbi:hypothetical protein SERLADRAFT_375180 [Serpula lacrymans var. lacrymans S7.9]|uniref:Fungal-type protein kinase domain-containing protein n=1 Tax=Serpula lacrymans var. lacrymans (strain S7.9) TaxID=578457 RepID=F8PER9_SERL9|nr:uncharacterized protein SERLADRAFT_375180 [Serpula lacrymans var. lacrymans S7.9]EGO18378.1 hypothetical protein SERLADRAFT_375180 [Serpula lacrymans var. lacrymans S7.9]